MDFFKWTDRVDGVDPASANDINTVAHAVEALNEEIKSLTSGGGGGGGGSGTDIKVPTKTSELENDSGFITGNDVPKKLSELENDVGYLKENSDSGAFINYGEGYAVNIGASADVSIASGGNVYLNGRNGTVVSAEEGKIAADFSNQRIANIADPKADTDGANKKYVDDAVKGIDIPDVSVPTKVSQLENDAGYITKFVDEMNVTGMLHTQSIYGHEKIDINSEHTFIGSIDGAGIDFGGYNTDRNYGQIEGDMRAQTPVNDASVANKGYVDGEITVHNTSTTAHNDIRLLISGLTSRLDAVANSDDTTLDQLSEIVAYIKANKSLIDSITTSKVNVSDIIDNLTTSVSNKPLSAKMGVELKKLIDAIKIPTTLPASDVYSWAKQPTKPTYTAAEVGAVAKNQGSANVGKILVVGSDGNLMLTDMPEGGGDVTGMVDEENNILLSGDLADGTYTLKYANADGTYSDVGTLVVGATKPSYTNLADPTSADWQEGYRLSISSGSTSALDGHTVTNYIPAKTGDVLRFKGLIIHSSSDSNGATSDPKFVLYKTDKTKLAGSYGTSGINSSQSYGTQVSVNGDISTYTVALLNDGQNLATSNCAYIRFDGFLMDGYTSEDVIITVNEEITE